VVCVCVFKGGRQEREKGFEHPLIDCLWCVCVCVCVCLREGRRERRDLNTH
jgi:hypothetical protein